jgi:AraC-like DNA-binding protein
MGSPTLDEAALPDVDRDLFRALLEMQLGTHVSLTKHVMGAWCVPARAGFALPRPRHAGLLERVLECTVAFDQPRTQVDYPAEWLDRPPQFANPIAATQVSAACAKLLEDHKWNSGTSRRVYAELTRTPGRFPGIDEIAAVLYHRPDAAATARRGGTTYGTAGERAPSLGRRLPVDLFLEVDDIAAALGFSDAASFRHAFKRWTGRTPTNTGPVPPPSAD